MPGEDYAFTIQELGGTFSGTAGPDGFAYDGQITARGFLSAGAPFTCTDQEAGQPSPTTRGAGVGRARLGPQALTPLVATTLTLHSNGRLVGEVTGLSPDCPITIGPFTAQVQNVALRFATGPGGQEAWLGGTAVVHYTSTDGQQLSASGQIGIDLVRPAIDTFHVVLQGPFVWGLPAESPVLSFQLNRAELDRLGLLIDGQQTFVLGDGVTRTVRFNALRLDWATGRIQSGAILFDEAFGLEVGIDTLTGELGYRAVTPETPLTMNPGLRFDLTGSVRLDSLGLFVTGEADARLHYAGQIHDSLRVAYADGFRLRFDPPRVYTGRADFFWGGTRIAWLDADGFHPDPNVFQLLIPERVPLPVESVAYLVIKRDGNLLLDVTRLDDGSIRLDTRPGQPLELVVPALQGSQPAPPSLQVQLTDVRFDAFWQWRSGEIHATVPPGDPAFDLRALGLPLSLQALGFGTVSLGAMETRGFYLKGNLLLFEQEISAAAPVTALVRTDRTVYVAVELSGLNTPIALVEGESAVRWHLQRVAGWWDGPLAAPGTATYRFELEGAFRLYDANDQVVAQAATQAWFEPAGLTLIGFQSDTSVAPMASLEAGPFYLQVDRLRSLLLTYAPRQGFDFFVDLDLRLGFAGEDWRFDVPLRGVTLRPDGFHLPAQEVHQHSDPPLIADPIPVGDFQIRPLAVRIPEVQVTWGSFDGRSVLDFLPHFDLELTLPGYAVTAPDLASVTLTLSDVGFSEGILTGTIEPYTFPAPGAQLLLGPPAADPPALYIEQVAGGLVRVETASGPQQGLDLTVQGYLAALPYVEDTTGCASVAFQLHLTGRGIEGTLSDFQTCGAIPIGPLALSLEQGSVTFAFQEGRQEAIARGTGRLRIPAPGANTTPVEVQGSIGLDLITGRLLEGAIELAQRSAGHCPRSSNRSSS
ncbi:hypothetical protein [Rhodothermus marinus]|uniref:hypothetical protein n=1 Tax=Rhodothermus marinus TaxID=29549 RepID=UPI001FB2C43D|nr:hypothetical protein [Rhodothermus marinus]